MGIHLENNLQNPKDKRKIICDETLRGIFQNPRRTTHNNIKKKQKKKVVMVKRWNKNLTV